MKLKRSRVLWISLGSLALLVVWLSWPREDPDEPWVVTASLEATAADDLALAPAEPGEACDPAPDNLDASAFGRVEEICSIRLLTGDTFVEFRNHHGRTVHRLIHDRVRPTHPDACVRLLSDGWWWVYGAGPDPSRPCRSGFEFQGA